MGRVVLAFITVVLADLLLVQGPVVAEVVARVNVSAAGVQGNNVTFRPMLSANGRYVVFDSSATNLVPSETNGVIGDIFIHDRTTRAMQRLTQGNNHSCYPSVSADGRFVAFQSNASDLIASDLNGGTDVFLHDRARRTTTLITVAFGGGPSNPSFNQICYSHYPVISADGRFIAFASDASNLVPNDTNGVQDVFVRDRLRNTTTRVSVATGGGQANGASGHFNGIAISADGRFIAFHSLASNLVPNDTNFSRDAFVHDRVAGITTRISLVTNGSQGNNWTGEGISLSPDGRYVAFDSFASNMDARCPSFIGHIFVRDRQLGTTACVSRNGNVPANGQSFVPALSADGRFVVFQSLATNLASGDTNGVEDVFVHDTRTGRIERVNVGPGGVQANCGVVSGGPVQARISFASADARLYSLESCATNLVASDTNNLTDVFVSRLATGPNWLVIGGGAPAAFAESPGALTGTGSRVVGFDALGQRTLLNKEPYPGFRGEVRVALGDVNGDGEPNLITGAGPGGGPHVQVFKGTTADGAPIASFLAYHPAFVGGIYVAACDVLGEGRAQVITGAGAGGGPHVRVFRIVNGQPVEVAGILAYTPAFTGGVRVACGDVDASGRASIITGPGPGGGPHVRVFKVSGNLLKEFTGFMAYPPLFAGGVSVAAGDTDGDGRAEIITGAGPGGGPHVRVLKVTGTGFTDVASYLAYELAFTAGVNVGAGDFDGDGRAEVLVSPASLPVTLAPPPTRVDQTPGGGRVNPRKSIPSDRNNPPGQPTAPPIGRPSDRE